MKILKTILFAFLIYQGYGQNYPFDIPYYDFIKYDSNIISYQNEKKDALYPFYNRLNEVIKSGKGNVNILHFGGSHIQADIWSGELRKQFQLLAPGMKGARGLVFPFDIAKTNNPNSYKTKYTGFWKRKRCATRKEHADWGLTGMQVYTHDTVSTFRIYAKSKYYMHYDFNRVKVFYKMDSTTFTPFILNSDTNYTITYDSILGCLEIQFENYQDTLSMKFLKTVAQQNQITIYGIQFENDDPGIIYHAMGVNGADLPSYIKCNLMQQQLPAVKPDLIIFSVGVNDAYSTSFNAYKYESNYKVLIDRIRELYPDVSILFTTNNDTYYRKRYPNKNAYKVKSVMQHLSKEKNAAIWDMFEVMGGLGSIYKWEQLELAKSDKIHFKGDGYRLIAHLMFAAIMKDYQNYLLSKVE